MRTPAGRHDRAVAARRGQGDISPQRPPRRKAVAVLLQQAWLQPRERCERLLPPLQEHRRVEILQGVDAPVLSFFSFGGGLGPWCGWTKAGVLLNF